MINLLLETYVRELWMVSTILSVLLPALTLLGFGVYCALRDIDAKINQLIDRPTVKPLSDLIEGD